MQVKEITGPEYYETYSKTNDLYVLVFHAVWCPPCKMFKITLDELTEKNNIPVYRVDVDGSDNTKIKNEFQVTSMPTWFIFKEGKMVQHGLGYLPYPAFIKEVEKHL
ncbi:Thioredoxin [Mycoplasmopsis meleagridis]|uniref:Thioredoxin n=1 Tax=Mycoplasmopsis meleagridis ATCC 25294 TaxID=1264554 RepID=A0A0F5H091_9BACT|nr:thioredoxin family protein [Mycoplasmopsis meleagridis]KKB26741.1 Thioredoxin [Mycoplasmopsis meleagridis ATCC 25294]KUH47561.1 thioredoxin [Mycoplasmopsis meleagridis]OAD18143.1 Thioredoxin [Mycoplasmopsis meleagridis]VEU77275.1 Thioredoxin [Mycoplasmopsis meleagridis]